MSSKRYSRRDFLKTMGMGSASLAVAGLVNLSTTLAQGEEIVIRYLTPSWASTTDRRAARQIAFRGVIDSFNDQFADQGIRVEEIVGDGNPLTITQEIEAGNVESIWFNHGNILNRLNADQLVDLTQYMDGELEQFFDFVQNTVTSEDGRVGALWHNTDTPLYYYNTTKIPTPPTTWSELRAICEQIQADEGTGKFGYVAPLVGWTQMNSGLYVARGGTFVDEMGAPIAFTEDNLAIWSEMFEFYVGLVQDGLIPSSAVANNQSQMLPDVFAGDVYSFAGNSNFHIRELQPNLPPDEYANWAAVPLPYPDSADGGRYVAGGWVIGAIDTGDEAKNAAAAAWAIFATNDRAQANTCKAGGWIPTRPGIIEEDPFYSEDAFAQTTLDALEQGYVVPLDPVYNPLRIAIETALQRAAAGDVSIDEALAEAEAETMREYEALQ